MEKLSAEAEVLRGATVLTEMGGHLAHLEREPGSSNEIVMKFNECQ